MSISLAAIFRVRTAILAVNTFQFARNKKYRILKWTHKKCLSLDVALFFPIRFKWTNRVRIDASVCMACDCICMCRCVCVCLYGFWSALYGDHVHWLFLPFVYSALTEWVHFSVRNIVIWHIEWLSPVPVVSRCIFRLSMYWNPKSQPTRLKCNLLHCLLLHLTHNKLFRIRLRNHISVSFPSTAFSITLMCLLQRSGISMVITLFIAVAVFLNVLASLNSMYGISSVFQRNVFLSLFLINRIFGSQFNEFSVSSWFHFIDDRKINLLK